MTDQMFFNGAETSSIVDGYKLRRLNQLRPTMIQPTNELPGSAPCVFHSLLMQPTVHMTSVSIPQACIA